MPIQNLNDNELNSKIKTLAVEERKLTQQILAHIAEVDRRKLHLRLAYPSLFEYLTQEIGYSAGSAQRRIDAARLMQKIPEVGVQIETGRLNLGQISKVQQICRAIKKESGEVVNIEKQKFLLQKIENQNSQQTDLILAQEFDRPVHLNERLSTQKDESVRVEFTFTKSEMELIQCAQNLLSHKSGGGLKSTILKMAHLTLKQKKTSNVTATVEVRSRTASIDKVTAGQATARNVNSNKTLTPKVRRLVLKRDQCCQFQDPETGRLCGAKHYLEIDHVQPKFAGGDNALTNLRVLCRNHNQYRYRAGC